MIFNFKLTFSIATLALSKTYFLLVFSIRGKDYILLVKSKNKFGRYHEIRIVMVKAL